MDLTFSTRGCARQSGFLGKFHRYRSDETVPSPRERLDVPRLFCVVPERCANLVDAKIDAPLEIDEGVVAPETLTNFFAGYDVTRAFCKQEQNSRRLQAQLDRHSRFAQFT